MTITKSTTEWQRVRFDDIAESITERVDDPKAAGVEIYVGLEHLDSNTTRISRYGTPNEVEASKLRFYPGDVIYARRRAYQRKLGVAEVEGICSAHALVLRAKPDVCLPEFLPYFLQSDQFHERALEISVGSLSPTINWRTLRVQEFVLPPLEDQGRIARVLVTTNGLTESQLTLQDAINLCREALWTDMYLRSGNETQLLRLGDLISLEYGNSLKKEDRSGGDFPVYGSSGVVGFHSEALTFEPMTIVVGRKGSAGSTELVHQRCWVIDTAYFVQLKRDDLEWEFIFDLLVHANLQGRTTQTAIPGLNREDAYGIEVRIPTPKARSAYLEQRKVLEVMINNLKTWRDKTVALGKAIREDLLAGVTNV